MKVFISVVFRRLATWASERKIINEPSTNQWTALWLSISECLGRIIAKIQRAAHIESVVKPAEKRL